MDTGLVSSAYFFYFTFAITYFNSFLLFTGNFMLPIYKLILCTTLLIVTWSIFNRPSNTLSGKLYLNLKIVITI